MHKKIKEKAFRQKKTRLLPVFPISSTESGLPRIAELITSLLLLVPGSRSGGCLPKSSGDNLSRESKVGAKVVNSLSGQVAVTVLPREGGADKIAAGERLHKHHNLEVGHSLNLGVGRLGGVLLDNTAALLKEVAVNSNTVLLGNEHFLRVELERCSSNFEKREKLKLKRSGWNMVSGKFVRFHRAGVS